MADLKMLKDISLAKGISGFEKEATRVMKSYMEDCVDDVKYDNLGSYVGIKNGTSQLKVLVTGHIDEIGFIVKDIDEGGFIQVQAVGGWMGQNLPSSLMCITNRDGDEIKGVFGSQPPHGKSVEERNKVVAPNDSFIDIGVLSKEEALKLGIRKGDPITPVSEFLVMGNEKCLMSKAWDDRIGVAVIIDVFKNLKGKTIYPTLFGAGTVQEEVGLRGAKTVGQLVKPDIALAIDVTFSKDLPGEKGDVKLGSGVSLSVMDGSVIAHTGLLKVLENICEKHNIAYQLDMITAGGTDSGELSKVEAGVMNMTLSIPSRYMHSHRTIINVDDYQATVDLITHFIEELDEELLNQIIEDKR
ncbi:MAG: M42 family metallopeptidase [Coprobacillus sp.]